MRPLNVILMVMVAVLVALVAAALAIGDPGPDEQCSPVVGLALEQEFDELIPPPGADAVSQREPACSDQGFSSEIVYVYSGDTPVEPFFDLQFGARGWQPIENRVGPSLGWTKEPDGTPLLVEVAQQGSELRVSWSDLGSLDEGD